jgi:hypothetical protein
VTISSVTASSFVARVTDDTGTPADIAWNFIVMGR